MNILSLFDGMSCGQIALNKNNIKYENYFASEIDKHAIKVTQHNYPDTIQLGDVSHITGDDLPHIDLLMGGTPCQGFSYAGKMLNFEDDRSKLFFDYVRLLEKLKPTYFLLENVVMKQEYQDVITKYLGVEPIPFNSRLLSAQNRPRLYWTNIPNVTIPSDKGIKLIDIMENTDFDREPYYEAYKSNKVVNYKSDKMNTLRSRAGSKTRGIGVGNDEGWWRKLTPLECERLQTVPENYTEIVSPNQRYTMLGNGWTVDVIAHIIKNI